MWFTTGSGRIELQITKDQARTGYHQGQCDEDVARLLNEPKIARQLRKLDTELVRDELHEYGAWDETQLSDHEQNLHRLVWLACADIVENG